MTECWACGHDHDNGDRVCERCAPPADLWGVKVWRAWDHEWVAECFAHGEVHWGGRWVDAMVVAWGHLAMHHGGQPYR